MSTLVTPCLDSLDGLIRVLIIRGPVLNLDSSDRGF